MSDNGGKPEAASGQPSPTACQVCGKEVRPPGAQVFGKAEVVNGKREVFVAVICMECMMKKIGLQWRKAPPQSKILVPSRTIPPGTSMS